MQRVFGELGNGSSVEITLAGLGHVTGPAFRRCNSMPNVVVQTVPADDAFDVELPSAATTQEPVSTDSSPPAADDSAQKGPAEIVADNTAVQV
ncbi:unnamed protein product [Macrosiphum euphorbiae]|uniref:Uncharacterized protein n=1 Tax=Macrosiphum euphorbiae TaxID=13131 RepID=A0AAV0WCG2_9HEMI|nr:unnamed protein product [Macrosiphum euphorbiae]